MAMFAGAERPRGRQRPEVLAAVVLRLVRAQRPRLDEHGRLVEDRARRGLRLAREGRGQTIGEGGPTGSRACAINSLRPKSNPPISTHRTGRGFEGEAPPCLGLLLDSSFAPPLPLSRRPEPGGAAPA